MTTTLHKKPDKKPGSTGFQPAPVKQTENKFARLTRATVRNSIWFVSSLLVSLAVLELAFRACGIGGEEYLKFHPILGYTHLENKLVAQRSEGWSNDRINSRGHREVETPVTPAPGVTRIAFLGDSKTESLQVPLEDNFVKDLERRLNALSEASKDARESSSTLPDISMAAPGAPASRRLLESQPSNPNQTKFECLNFGMSGYGTTQELLQYMHEVRQYKPKVTVLMYHVLDKEENTAPLVPDTVLPRPYFSVTDEGILRPEWAFLDAWLYSERGFYYRAFDALRRNSSLFGVISQINFTMSGNRAYGFYTKRILLPTLELASTLPFASYSTSDETRAARDALKKEFEKPVAHFGSTLEEQIPDRSAPDFLKKDYNIWLLNHRLQFRVTAALIRKLNQVCNESGSRLIVAALPAPSSQTWYFRELNALKQIAKEDNFAFVNIHTKFPQHADNETSPHFIGFHFSREGHQLIADILTPEVKSQLPK